MLHLTLTQQRYLLLKQLLPAILINFIVNFAFGWLFFHTSEQVPLWQALSFSVLPTSIVVDLIPTSFYLIFLTSLIVSRQVQHHMRDGLITPITNPAFLCRISPLHGLMTSFRLALLITLILVPGTVLIFHWNNIDALPLWDFIYFKSFYATALAALFTPFVVLRAMVGEPALIAEKSLDKSFP